MTVYYREGYRPPEPSTTATVSTTAKVRPDWTATLAWLTCAALYALYKAAGGALLWWPVWVALGLAAVAVAVEAGIRGAR